MTSNFIVNKFLRSFIESYCKDNLKVLRMELKKDNENLILLLVIGECNYSGLLELFIKKIENSKNEMIGSLVLPMTRIFNGILSDEQKENILIKSINDCQKGIISVIENVVRKKGKDLEIAEIACYRINDMDVTTD